MSAIIFFGVIAVLVFFVIGIYNGLVTARNGYKNAFSQIDVQLQRRMDLIANLVETVKRGVRQAASRRFPDDGNLDRLAHDAPHDIVRHAERHAAFADNDVGEFRRCAIAVRRRAQHRRIPPRPATRGTRGRDASARGPAASGARHRPAAAR